MYNYKNYYTGKRAGYFKAHYATQSWTEAKTSYSVVKNPGSLITSVDVPSSFATGWITFDVKNAIQKFVNTPSSNHGFVLSDKTGVGGYSGFR